MRLTDLSGYMPRVALKTKNIELNVLYDSFLELQLSWSTA